MEGSGLCTLRIHDILSACVVWFTFVFRTQGHRAVGSWGDGLTRSRGLRLFAVATPSPFVPLVYHTLGSLSRGFFRFLEKLRDYKAVDSTPGCLSALPPDTIIIPQVEQNVKHFGKNNFFFYFRKNS